MKRLDDTVWPDGPDRRDAQDQNEGRPQRAAQRLRARDLQPLLALINQAAPLCATRLAGSDPGGKLVPMQQVTALHGQAPALAARSPPGAATPAQATDLALDTDTLPFEVARPLATGDQATVRIEVLPVPDLGDAAYLIVLSPRAPPAGTATVATRGPMSGPIPDENNVGSSDPRLLALGLTPRQADIVARLALGHSNKAIARGLDIAPATVKKHLEDAYRRLGVRNRTEAALAARSALIA